jgi:adenylosuccinate synthase
MKSLFSDTGVHCLVDGQFGSTGKGVLAAWLASQADLTRFGGAICSNGPNSGHTSYYQGEKIVLKQLPTFAVHALKSGFVIPAYLSAGAVINMDILREEALRFYNLPIFVHPNAAVINDADLLEEQNGTIKATASTQSGTGACLARKMRRDPDAIAANALKGMPDNVAIMRHNLHPEQFAYFMEVAQGFSLGINSEFYPHVTSRECTVMQGIADARIAPQYVARTYMSIRTFPIRVGNLEEHSSGGWYDDQEEISWEQLGVEPELTTVTKRVRRVATFSGYQLMDALHANAPDFLFVNFMNYIPADEQREFLWTIRDIIKWTKRDIGIITGHGPTNEDVQP